MIKYKEWNELIRVGSKIIWFVLSVGKKVFKLLKGWILYIIGWNVWEDVVFLVN